MMPLTEAGAPAQGGGPAGTGWARGRRWRLPRQKSFLHGLCRPLRPHPGFGESDSAELASLHLLPRTRSARRNYRIAGARLMRSNYPPPLFSAALCCAGPTHPN
ncbi:LOW QUALITY PROTEIN: putative uncharacterized protein encoded by LINC03040 [Mustela lutreola]|uniref:LOW QUALITY PROTEIN: putative uncharacterized protein encoded by LINC03040 n=1 Tax=Mustela lutreola TaxID=9666 RepID=UPI00034402D0|nr:LOW QUALITY PROTEIN: putative uncharacterized protein encoded by LINC03040 [Mustela lutreola]